MIKLVPSTEQDIEQLTEWIKSDPYHKDCLNPVWWLTGADGSLLCYCLQDSEGPLCYVRLDPKDSDGLIRLHTQFAPVEQISKIRLVKGMLKCVPIMMEFCKQQQATGLVFESRSSLLIDFMKRKFGFKDLSQDQFVWHVDQGG